MNTHVTVLSSGTIAGASRVHGNSVERTEMTTDTADLVLEDLVVESGLEFTLAGGCRCDVHGGLATTENDVFLLWRDGSGVEGGIGWIGLHDGEIAGRDDLGVY